MRDDVLLMRGCAVILGAICALLLPPGPAGAASLPERIEYQGILLDPHGLPLDGVVSLQIGIWADAVDTSPSARLYFENHTSVPVVRGVFRVEIGSGSPATPTFSASVFDADGRWLEVTVNGEILTPRQRLASAAYSLHCERADVASDAATLGGWAAGDYQLRVDGTCAAGESISAITADGSATCETDDALAGDITAISAGSGLALVPGATPGDFTARIGTAAVTQPLIVDGAITAVHLAASSVTNTAFQLGAIGGSHVADGSLTGADLAAGSVTGAKLANATIGTLQLANASVGSTQIAPGAVQSAKIANDSVNGNLELAAGAVTAPKLVDGAVRNANLQLTITDYGVSATSPTETSVTSSTGHEYCVLSRVSFTAHDAGTNRYCAIDQTATTFILRARAGTGGTTRCEMSCM